jgi:hypothetical protein
MIHRWLFLCRLRSSIWAVKLWLWVTILTVLAAPRSQHGFVLDLMLTRLQRMASK